MPGVDYGMNPETGEFIHPKAMPMVTNPPGFEGQLDYPEQKSCIENMEVIAALPEISSGGHAWQNVVVWGNQRLLYVYADPGRNLNIFDITDPRNTKLLYVEYDRNII